MQKLVVVSLAFFMGLAKLVTSFPPCPFPSPFLSPNWTQDETLLSSVHSVGPCFGMCDRRAQIVALFATGTICSVTRSCLADPATCEGEWSAWRQIKDCNATCGPSYIHQGRACFKFGTTNVSNQYCNGGKGARIQLQFIACETNPCPIQASKNTADINGRKEAGFETYFDEKRVTSFTSTIALGVILGLAAFFVIILTIAYILKRQKRRNNTNSSEASGIYESVAPPLPTRKMQPTSAERAENKNFSTQLHASPTVHVYGRSMSRLQNTCVHDEKASVTKQTKNYPIFAPDLPQGAHNNYITINERTTSPQVNCPEEAAPEVIYIEKVHPGC